MKCLHLADLHLGKRVNEFSMLEDQKYMLDKIVELIKSKKIDVLLIAGDIFDSSIPPAEAVNLLSDFISDLHKIKVKILMITGNHDSKDRLVFLAPILEKQGVVIIGDYQEGIKKIKIDDVNFYLLPYVKYQRVNHFFNQSFTNTNDAIKFLIAESNINYQEKNVILAHQFVIAKNRPEESDSEMASLGGLDEVNAQIFSQFNYTALGHIHKSQKMGNNIYYSGSLLKYSTSEAKSAKKFVIVDTNDFSLDFVSIEPLHDLLTFECYIDDLINGKTLSEYPNDNYYSITVLDSDEIINPMDKIKSIYPLTMTINFKNQKFSQEKLPDVKINSNINIFKLFQDFYQAQTATALNDKQSEIIKNLLDEEEI